MKRVGTISLGMMFVLVTVTGAFAQGAQPQGRRGGGAAAPVRGPAAPACTTLACDVQLDWARTAQLLLMTVEAMPADKFDYRPTEPQQTFAERALHIAQTDLRLLGTLGAKTPPPTINAKATSKAEVLAALKQSFSWGEAAIKEFSEAQLIERITPPPFMGQSASRARVIYYSLQHTQDIYGQIVVYLRLSGTTPPASNRGV